ncbi:FK506 binding protein 11, 19 kDa [Columba livia]|uniref:peptidylprolyl isomerase n=1 Tax=Columba livia TaxID=8932 RepID=A0A2I0LKJ9_COLLI|nr:FK506 binding protein 11, 19 kDa [Columba livia]
MGMGWHWDQHCDQDTLSRHWEQGGMSLGWQQGQHRGGTEINPGVGNGTSTRVAVGQQCQYQRGTVPGQHWDLHRDGSGTVPVSPQGSLEDGRVIDTSLTRDPLQVELGKRQVILGLEQSLLDMCVGEKRRAIIPPHLAYGKRGSPPTIPGDAVLRFEVELVGLSRAGYWQKLVNEVVPLLCLGLVPALLALIGCHLYRKASSPRLSKKKMKEEKKNKAKKK